ncbi:MAG TPA: tetratricopeptide repeat protein [Gammaproteobacteria bacterium]|jgi:TPR repeat protein|nr:tetratricopeptide repeat protein [Gammaproteobacteria bacterium]
MIRAPRSVSDSYQPAFLALMGLALALAAPLASADDHLPPGIKVVYIHPPAYVDKVPGHTTYTDQDIEQAGELARLGDAEAQANLGVMLTTRGKYAEAATWYKRAADMGIATAAYNLGTLYYNGQGFPQDYAQARHWFELAARRNDPYAEFQLGMMYGNGKGVDPDPAAEMRWYTKAASQGLPAAQYNLAVMYHNAEGVEQQDDVRAYAWLLLAQRGGVDIAEAKPVITDGMSEEQMQAAEKLSRTLYVAADAYKRQ